MRVIHRRDAGSEKCPRCSRVNVDFIELQEGVWGCLDCGCVFLTKVQRVKVRVGVGYSPRGTVNVPDTVRLETTAGVDAMAWTRSESGGSEASVGPVGDTVTPPAVEGFECGECGKVLKTKLGLSGHMRSHMGGE